MGKVCVITGASQGIGRAAAVRMSREPNVGSIVLVARNGEGLDGTVAEMDRDGKRIEAIPYDLMDLDGIPALVDRIQRDYGSIDILLNIAGYADPRSLLDTSTDNIVKTYTINVFAMLVLIREATRHMYDRGGKILNVASTAGITSRPGWLAYASSKAAVVSLSRDPRGRAGRQRDQDLQHLAGANGHRAAPQAGAGGGPLDDHAAGPGGRRHRPADERRRGHPRRPEHHRPHAGLDRRMRPLEYRLASALLRFVRLFASRLAIQSDKVVLATARVPTLDGNLLHLHRAMRARHPELRYVLLLEPYSYGLAGKLAYLVRLVRGMYHLQTARLFVTDNAYLPIHVAPHRRRTTVVQVWHAAGALKRFGLDTTVPIAEPERTFLHRYYDAVVVGGEWTRGPYAAALRTPIERVIALGSPRTDFFFDDAALAAARGRVLAAHPELAGRRVVLYAPTFRGRGIGKRAATGLDAAALRAALPAGDALVLKTHPNLDPAATPTAGYDVVADPTAEINDLLALTDILITDYSSSVIEFALLRRPIVLLVGDLAEYEVDPGLYLDYRTDMIGTQVTDTAGVIDAIIGGSVRPRRVRRVHHPAAGCRAGRCQRPLRRPVPGGRAGVRPAR